MILNQAYALAEEKGLFPVRNPRGFVCRCPCHDDHSPSLSALDSEGEVKFTCHAGCDWKTIRQWFGADSEKPSRNGLKPLSLNELARAKRLDVGFLKSVGVSQGNWFDTPCVEIQYRAVLGAPLLTRYRLGDGEFRWQKGTQPVPYGLDRLHQAKAARRITLVEGESDAWTLWHSGEPALGIPGAKMWRNEFARYLQDIPEIYLLEEPDQAGQGFVASIARCEALRDRLRVVRLPGGIKDPSALWCDDPERFGERWAAALAAAQPPAAAHSRVATRLEQQQVEPASLSEVLDCFHRWLYLEDDGYLKVTLGAYAANHLPGDPVWLMLVGPPGGGKTEVLAALAGLPQTRFASSISGESALLSGSSKKDRSSESTGGLLRELGEFGVLILSDFTSILSMKHEQRVPLLAALREIHDGKWSRRMGVDGGRLLEWSGKLGLIAASTPVIDTHHAVIASMGERFITHRLPPTNERAQAARALDNDGRQAQMRRELSLSVQRLFAGIDLARAGSPLSADQQKVIIDIATLACRCRSSIERDQRTREILFIPPPESPGRLASALSRLFRGLLTIGVDEAEALQLLAKTATDCVPSLRWSVFREVASLDSGEFITTRDLAIRVSHPTQTTRRSLEDLAGHSVIERSAAPGGTADHWRMTGRIRDLWGEIRPFFVPVQAGVPGKSLGSVLPLHVQHKHPEGGFSGNGPKSRHEVVPKTQPTFDGFWSPK